MDGSPHSTQDIAAIVADRRITPVFQPIYQVRDGSVFGYEALTRGPVGPLHNPVNLFAAAEAQGLEAQLDALCRTAAANEFRRQGLPGALFVNVSPQIIVDLCDQRDAIVQTLQQWDMPASAVVVEISERHPFDPIDAIVDAIRHFCEAGFRFALDDLGAGYAGLRVWSELRPAFVKMDRHFVSGCDRDSAKREFLRSIKGMSNFLGCQVIAEGIEREEEADVIRSLGVDLAQGFLLCRPDPAPPMTATMVFQGGRRDGFGAGLTFNESLERLVQPSATVAPTDTAESVLDRIREWKELPDIPVVDGSSPLGSVNRVNLLDRFSRRYTRELHGRRPIRHFMDDLAPVFELSTSIEEASRQLSSNSRDVLPSCAIIVANGQFCGVVPTTALMRRLSEAQMRAARYSNPLTLLPGNVPTMELIQEFLDAGTAFRVAYCDLNNFKPFNDVYGYAIGDEALRLVAEILAEQVDADLDYIGHIGGDDFVVVSRDPEFEATVHRIAAAFGERVRRLYRPEHVAMDGILAVDRAGNEAVFPLMRLAIGVVKPDPAMCDSHHDVATMAADAKHHAKMNPPEYLFFCRRNSPRCVVEVGEGDGPDEPLHLYKV